MKEVLNRLNKRCPPNTPPTWSLAYGGDKGKDEAIRMNYSAAGVGDERFLVVFVKSSKKSPSVDLEFDSAAIGFNFVAQSSLGQLNCGKSFLCPNILLKFI